MNKKISALEKASEKLGTIALDVYAWFNQKHKDDNKNRNLFISAVYDYLKVLEVADSNSDNHSFKQLSDLIWSLVGLQENEHNNSYFRKFANVCVKGGLLLHWQDIKKEDENGDVIQKLQFAKKDKNGNIKRLSEYELNTFIKNEYNRIISETINLNDKREPGRMGIEDYVVERRAMLYDNIFNNGCICIC